jgi:hypothetical protein
MIFSRRTIRRIVDEIQRSTVAGASIASCAITARELAPLIAYPGECGATGLCVWYIFSLAACQAAEKATEAIFNYINSFRLSEEEEQELEREIQAGIRARAVQRMQEQVPTTTTFNPVHGLPDPIPTTTTFNPLYTLVTAPQQKVMGTGRRKRNKKKSKGGRLRSIGTEPITGPHSANDDICPGVATTVLKAKYPTLQSALPNSKSEVVRVDMNTQLAPLGLEVRKSTGSLDGIKELLREGGDGYVIMLSPNGNGHMVAFRTDPDGITKLFNPNPHTQMLDVYEVVRGSTPAEFTKSLDEFFPGYGIVEADFIQPLDSRPKGYGKFQGEGKFSELLIKKPVMEQRLREALQELNELQREFDKETKFHRKVKIRIDMKEVKQEIKQLQNDLDFLKNYFDIAGTDPSAENAAVFPVAKPPLPPSSLRQRTDGRGKSEYELHAIIVHKPFPLDQAREIAHDIMKSKKDKFMRETSTSYRFRNIPKTKFASFFTKVLNPQVSLIFGVLK